MDCGTARITSSPTRVVGQYPILICPSQSQHLPVRSWIGSMSSRQRLMTTTIYASSASTIWSSMGSATIIVRVVIVGLLRVMLFVHVFSKHKGCVFEDTSSVDRCVPILMKRKQKQKFFKSNIMNLTEVLIMVGCLAYIAVILYQASKTMNDE